MPDASLDSFFFWNSGSEAVEAAIKMARTITGKQNIIAMQGGYHGRTFGAMAVTKSKTIYSEGFHPLMVSVISNAWCSTVLTRSLPIARCFLNAVPILAPARRRFLH
jgi:4-aminobutyrate aminotransferase-like enzyme